MAPLCCFIPDHHCGLFVRDGVPERWLRPGHHILPREAGRAELRVLPGRSMDGGHPPTAALDVPYGRAFLFVDGCHVATLSQACGSTSASLSMWEGTAPTSPRASPQPSPVAPAPPLAVPWWILPSPTRSR